MQGEVDAFARAGSFVSAFVSKGLRGAVGGEGTGAADFGDDFLHWSLGEEGLKGMVEGLNVIELYLKIIE